MDFLAAKGWIGQLRGNPPNYFRGIKYFSFFSDKKSSEAMSPLVKKIRNLAAYGRRVSHLIEII
jgi:hypothetical protein